MFEINAPVRRIVGFAGIAFLVIALATAFLFGGSGTGGVLLVAFCGSIVVASLLFVRDQMRVPSQGERLKFANGFIGIAFIVLLAGAAIDYVTPHALPVRLDVSKIAHLMTIDMVALWVFFICFFWSVAFFGFRWLAALHIQLTAKKERG